MKYHLGISAGFHDAAVAVVSESGDISFAAHSERYSKIKNDSHLNEQLLAELCNYDFKTINYYERAWLHNLRLLYTGQNGIGSWTTSGILKEHLGSWYKHPAKEKSWPHHLSHAASGFQTSPFDRATVVVIDAIGEFDTVSIWGAEYDSKGRATYKKLWGQKYPHSLGLFYSAITKRVGLHPLDEEYITMGMAAWGNPHWTGKMYDDLIVDPAEVTFTQNLHLGLEEHWLDAASDVDIASSAQYLLESLIYEIMTRAVKLGWSRNLVYQGGVALNCLANRNLGAYFDRIWIMPNPGDAGSSLGAAALAYGRKLNWTDANLGHNIPGDYPSNACLDYLLRDGIVGVASGRAEFGPRALGNRSLLADPRGPEIKDMVNAIKRRQQFRPFAPVILAEHVHDYFDVPRGFVSTDYMQVVARCRYPDLFPAIVHVDGTSRVQTVPKNSSGIRDLLEKWLVLTDCPMLLNTSLNIRGEPMVNDRADADRFERLYGVKVCS